MPFRMRVHGIGLGRGLRRAMLVAVLALTVLGLAVALATAAPPTAPISFASPSPGEQATLTTDSVAFKFTINKKPKSTGTLTCALAGPTPSSAACDPPVASGTGSQSGKSYSGLANGSYRLTVSMTQKNGGTDTATRHFSIHVPSIYWANHNDGTIGRANLDGTGVNQNFIINAGVPTGVAADGSHIYWGSVGEIDRANLDGTRDDSFHIDAHDPQGIAVDSSHIYWVDGGQVQRANLDGTGAEGMVGLGPATGGVAVDSSHIYWADRLNHTIGRANLDGTGVNQNFVTDAGTVFGRVEFDAPTGVAVNGSSIYWGVGDFVRQADLATGMSPRTLGGGHHPWGVAVEGSHTYFTNQSSNTVGRGNLDPGGFNPNFIVLPNIGDTGNLWGVAVDGG
jgi:virginiamycin B lyase